MHLLFLSRFMSLAQAKQQLEKEAAERAVLARNLASFLVLCNRPFASPCRPGASEASECPGA